MNPAPIIRPRFRYAVAAVALLATAAIAFHHFNALATDGVQNTEVVYMGAFFWFVLIAVVPYFHRDMTARDNIDADYLNKLRVNVTVPVHNEDPEMFRTMLDSVAAQTRLPQRLHVVENGYPTPKLRRVFEEWKATSCPPEIDARYDHITEASKRVGQVVAWDQDPDMDIVVTLDSDVLLDPDAIRRGIQAFIHPRVMSVAGLTIGLNHQKNLLTRLIEAPYVCSFIGGRAAFSMLNSVAVNCGTLAFYRAKVVRKYRDHYLNFTIAGRKFAYGDDAMLTRYCLLEGWAKFQAGSWGYTLHPENIKHLTKQRLRWWRSYFWGNIWLLMAFNPTRVIWWLTAWKFVSFVWYTAIIPIVLMIYPTILGHLPVAFFAWVVLIGALAQIRYLSIKRPDETFRSQIATVALAPLSALLNVYLGWVLQYIGLFTCLKTGWSTRSHVEVGLDRKEISREIIPPYTPRHSREVRDENTVVLQRVEVS